MANLDNTGKPTPTVKEKVVSKDLPKFIAAALKYAETRPDFAPALKVERKVVAAAITAANPMTEMGAKRALSRFVRTLPPAPPAATADTKAGATA